MGQGLQNWRGACLSTSPLDGLASSFGMCGHFMSEAPSLGALGKSPKPCDFETGHIG